MLYEYKPGSQRNAFTVLVIEDNPDHQSLIGMSLQKSFPEAKSVFMDSAQQALDHLNHFSGCSNDFPRLVLLDVYLPQPELGWHLLSTLRARYQRLPVIVFSAHYEPQAIRTAYDLGAHSFISKPGTGQEWATYFDSLANYWLRTVTLPPAHSL
jgi:CheY-like chemotaxis protein